MTPFVWRLAEALEAAQKRERTKVGFGAYVTSRVPAAFIDAFAAVMVRFIREISQHEARQVLAAEARRAAEEAVEDAIAEVAP